MSRGRLVLTWFGREIASIEAELRQEPDGTRTVVPVDEPAPIQTGVSGLADTALGEQRDPGTRHSGFGLPLAPETDPDNRPRRHP